MSLREQSIQERQIRVSPSDDDDDEEEEESCEENEGNIIEILFLGM